jgi:hypothetical protein
MLIRWLEALLLYCYQQCKRVNGCAGMAQVFAAIEAEQAGPQSVPTKNAA